MEDILMVDFTSWMKVYQTLPENIKRWVAAQKAIELGRGGIKEICEVTGMSKTTLIKGMKEIKGNNNLQKDRIRNQGGGRKTIESGDKKIITAIEKVVSNNTAGNPMHALKWTSKTSRNIANELIKKGFEISHATVCRILHNLEYSLQSNRKILATKNNPDRNEQFLYINKLVSRFSNSGDPVISVDTKKKELVGNFKQQGKVWSKKHNARAVYDHDFRSLGKGMAIPYGTYDVQENEGFVNIGTSSDTAEFAVNSILQWWKVFGCKRYPDAKRILICADGGGSNSSRSRLWKKELQALSHQLGISITVCHYPPGTSKWNKIEHRMFSFISLNWKGVPLENYETVVNLIGATKTKTGLKIKARLDKKDYKKGMKVSEEDFKAINLQYSKKYPQWNYTIKAA